MKKPTTIESLKYMTLQNTDKKFAKFVDCSLSTVERIKRRQKTIISKPLEMIEFLLDHSSPSTVELFIKTFSD